jgi:hypothetical protein
MPNSHLSRTQAALIITICFASRTQWTFATPFNPTNARDVSLPDSHTRSIIATKRALSRNHSNREIPQDSRSPILNGNRYVYPFQTFNYIVCQGFTEAAIISKRNTDESDELIEIGVRFTVKKLG